MSRGRYSREGRITVLVIFLVAILYTFIVENWNTIITIFYILAGLSITAFSIVIIIKIVKQTKRKKAYQETDYFKETGIPYSKQLDERGIKFEIDCYNKIRKAVGPHYPMLTDLLVPQYNAINKDSQIDLILFHVNGIFVIEMKNYSGPLIGSIDDERWIPYIAKRRKGKKGNFEDVYEKNWALYDRVSGVWKPLNPVKQNAGHVETLQKIFPSHYINMVILSDSMFVSADTSKSMIENVMSIDDFIDSLKYNDPVFQLEDLRDLYLKIKNIDRRNDPKAKLLHIARVKSIEQAKARRK